MARLIFLRLSASTKRAIAQVIDFDFIVHLLDLAHAAVRH